ncbi:MAG: hypothetical protein IJY80_02885 [Opitutales bacterium]|nr:hypothetical protein [Opitutales bacterium]
MLVEWIHCLSGKRGKITVFPAAVSADGNNPGVTLRLAENGVKICPDFRAKDISFNGKKVLSSALLEPGVPAFLRMGKSLLVACAKNATDETDWAAHYISRCGRFLNRKRSTESPACVLRRKSPTRSRATDLRRKTASSLRTA